MAIPKDELSLIVRDWYYAASEGNADEFLGYFLQDQATTYFGTDPDEQWYGIQEIRANFEENFRMYGKWTIMSKNLQIHAFGDMAFFTDEVELAAMLGDSSMAEAARMTGALIRKDGKWRIIQAHFSMGVANRALLPG